MKKIFKLLEKKPVLFTVILSVVLNFFIEILARRSLFNTLAYTITNPFVMIYNTVIILFTLSAALYFSKRYSMYLLVSFVWVVLGIVNCVVIQLRGTPLSAMDFAIFKTGFTLMHLYVSWPVLILFGVLALLAITGIVLMFIKSKKIKPAYIKAVALTVISAVAIFFTSHSILTSEEVSAAGRDISKTYEDYGFACCFSYSLFGRGIALPDTYSAETMDKVVTAANSTPTKTPEMTPNIIFVQLESFFDPEYLDINGLEFSEEVLPNFTKLKEECPSGFFQVPAFGGGTANTEFEVLSQFSLESFGFAEYPYSSVLKEKSCESAAYCLKEYGYKTHAMHNHTATFYDRDTVYENLGFDTFTPIEYMGVPERNSLGWAKDYILEDEIIKALKSTPEQDFVFAVSVQGHGQYPTEPEGDMPITVTGIDDAEIKTNLEYYLAQIHEMDDFIGKFTATLSEYSEPTVVVFYGDHLPNLKLGEISTAKLGYYPVSCDRYSTEYVIWSNFGLGGTDENISSHMLSSKVFSMLGMNAGIVTKLNQSETLAPEVCRAYRKLCAYDIFYGNRYIAEKEDLTPPEMRLGTEDITVSGTSKKGESVYISGNGFNKYSIICINGKKIDTEFVSEHALKADAAEFKSGCRVSVVQDSDIKTLGESNSVVY